MPITIKIEEIEQGMIIASPILNRYGQVLVSEGVEVNQKHLKIFKTWGIQVINIKTETNDDNFMITDELKAQAEEKFSSRLNWYPNSEIEKNLYQMGINKTLHDLVKRIRQK